MARMQHGSTGIKERYRFEHLIGRGGMGTVWRATDLLLERPVAVKDVLLPPQATEDDRRRARVRVMREANAAARVSHPAVVTVFDVIEEHERLYLVMELVDAPSLEALVTGRGPLPPGEVAALGGRLADALGAAHVRGVVHRDVKPSNVLVPDGGRSAKLVDFGIAAIADTPGITATGLAVGSPSFMSPEQADGRPASAASDVFSLGATLYFAVEGDGPFQRATSMATLAAVAAQPPRPPERAGALGPLLVEMMAKDPDARPSVDEVRHQLAALADADAAAPAATPSLPPPDPPDPNDTRLVASLAVPPPEPAGHDRRDRQRLARAGLAAALLVAAALALVLAVVGRDGDGGGGAATTVTAPPETTTPPPETTVPPGTTMPPPDTTAPPPDTTAPPETTMPPEPGPPAGFTEYVDPQGGFRMLLPHEMAVALDERRRLTEATVGYVRIGVRWFDPGVKPDGFLERERQRIVGQPRYRELTFEERPFRDYPGGFWEYDFAFRGNPDRLLHSTGRAFSVHGHTFALFFRGPAEDFDALEAQVFDVVEQSFQPLVTP